MYEDAIAEFIQEAVGGEPGAADSELAIETTEADTLDPDTSADMDSVEVDSNLSDSDTVDSISIDYQAEILEELQASNAYLAGIYEQELYNFVVLFIILVLMCIAGFWKIVDNIIIKPML